MSRCALVTGGSGFIGTHLVARLVAQGWDVRILDTVRPDGPAAATWIAADVRDRAAVGDAARGVDVVVHLAAVVGVDRLLGDPLECIDVTVAGTRHVVDAAGRAGAAMVHLSTSEVLGSNPAVPWSEEADRMLGSPLVDRWSYGAAKATAEHVVLAGASRWGVPATVVRPFNVYGPGQDERFVVGRMVRAALVGGPLYVHGNGRQTRCFTYVDDLTDGIVRVVARAGEIPLVHLGATDPTSVLDLAATVVAVVGGSPRIEFVDPAETWGRSYEDIPHRLPDVTLARSVLGWSATTPLVAGVERTVEWARTQSWARDLPDPP